MQMKCYFMLLLRGFMTRLLVIFRFRNKLKYLSYLLSYLSASEITPVVLHFRYFGRSTPQYDNEICHCENLRLVLIRGNL